MLEYIIQYSLLVRINSINLFPVFFKKNKVVN
jgi:hypothetical protein